MDFTRNEAKAWALENVKGFYMCPLTPFNEDGTFDEEGIRSNIEAYIEMGLNAIVVGGFVSECWNLNLGDWMRFHEIVADQNKGRLDLWTIILDPSVHQALDKMHFVEKLGYNGAEVINPIVQLRSDQEIFDYYKYMTDRSDLAICLYRTPVSGKVLGFELTARLAELETVIGVKQGDLNRAVTMKMRREMRDDFIIMDPSEYWYCEEQREGGQVLWGELSYILYGKKRDLVNDYVRFGQAGEYEKSRAAWEALAPVRNYYEDEFLWTIAATATYASALGTLKHWYEAIGLKAGPCLAPVATPSAARGEEIKAKLIELGVA